LGWFGLAPISESRRLISEIVKLELANDELKLQLRELEDENKSLWTMLDEMGNSSKMNRQTVDDFVEEVREALMEEMLKDFDPIGEA
jgi:molecular chaperone GrpE (heat shock protein)